MSADDTVCNETQKIISSITRENNVKPQLKPKLIEKVQTPVNGAAQKVISGMCTFLTFYFPVPIFKKQFVCLGTVENFK